MLGFFGAVSTFVVGVTIFYTLREVVKRMNAPVELQHKMIENKSERDQGAGILSLIPVQRKIFW
ncbi:MAG TPA: hypothetical protein VKA09_09765 [Nitrososphaeraceae archaeon]|nr:hypothetical protein [Nitrososphaeraceae archaeon]